MFAAPASVMLREATRSGGGIGEAVAKELRRREMIEGLKIILIGIDCTLSPNRKALDGIVMRGKLTGKKLLFSCGALFLSIIS